MKVVRTQFLTFRLKNVSYETRKMIAEILQPSIKSCTEYSVSANCHIKLHRTHSQNRLLDNILKGCFFRKKCSRLLQTIQIRYDSFDAIIALIGKF